MALGVVLVGGHLSPAAAAAPSIGLSHGVQRSAAALAQTCTGAGACIGPARELAPVLSLPPGERACSSSGPAAACDTGGLVQNDLQGQASTPAGMVDCPAVAGSGVPANPAGCTDTLMAAALAQGGATPTAAGPAAPAGGALASASPRPPEGLSLGVDSSVVRAGAQVEFTATATDTVSGTGRAIEIFDQTSGSLIGACGEKTECSVAYTLKGGGSHAFTAYITSPNDTIPAPGQAIVSNTLQVSWLESAISASDQVVAPGQSVVVTATSSVDVRPGGRWLEIYDLATHTRLTYCTHGDVCMTSLAEPTGGVHELVAHVSGSPESISNPIQVTWLTVNLAASTMTRSGAGPVFLEATVNADLSQSAWQLGIYDQNGRLVGQPCSSGSTCRATAFVNAGASPTYTAAVTVPPDDQVGRPGQTRPLASQGLGRDLIAESTAVKPAHLMWGVDSCKPFTSDPTGQGGLYPAVVSRLGTPDFWGRYLTDTVCPGISQAEVSAAAYNHMGILPIYNDYNCSAVVGYGAGQAYAAAAAAAAENLGIPQGRGLAIDIEPPGPYCPGAANVDQGFIEGWYDGVSAAGYAPVYYGNGTAGSAFANAWCGAVASKPALAAGSYLWSFEPSLIGGFAESTAPGFGPYGPGCDQTMSAWQYTISAGGNPDVDQDLALSTLPLWFP